MSSHAVKTDLPEHLWLALHISHAPRNRHGAPLLKDTLERLLNMWKRPKPFAVSNENMCDVPFSHLSNKDRIAWQNYSGTIVF